MSSSKLSDTQKQEIVQIYQETPEETTITLAERYGVSSSTVRRILQSAIPKELYDSLTQQKQRLHRTGKRSGRKAQTAETSTPVLTVETQSEKSESQSTQPESETESGEVATPVKRRRKRSSASESDASEEVEEIEGSTEASTNPKKTIPSPIINRQPVLKPEVQQLTLEDFLNPSEELSEFEAEEEDDYTEEEEEIEIEGNVGNELLIIRHKTLSPSPADQIQILPLSEANLPRTCYLVIDRFSELITRPLKAFSELGQIPPEEIQKKTLPIFDNHRVASRFSARNQRVFKVPDSQLLQKTAPYLQAKGITRLLVDGQVYRL